MNALQQLYAYQKVRFPLHVLLFTTAVSIGTSAAVIYYETSILQAIIAFATTMLLLFHIRVNDEFRDSSHDAEFHPNHPQHSGIISLTQLQKFDILGISLYAILCAFSGIQAIVYGIAALLFILLARKDFFLKKYFTNKPIAYHIVNSPQMLILQLQIYGIVTQSFELTQYMILNILLVYANIFVLEIVRKIKLPNLETIATDTYSKVYGFSFSIIFAWIWACISIGIIFVFLYSLPLTQLQFFISSGIIASLFLTVSISYYLHLKQKITKTEKRMIAASVALYLGTHISVILIFIV